MKPTTAYRPRRSLEDIKRVFRTLAADVLIPADGSITDELAMTLTAYLAVLRDYMPGHDPPDMEDLVRMHKCQLWAKRALEEMKIQDAIHFALIGLNYAPHNPELMLVLASAFGEKGKYEESLELYEQALWVRPNLQGIRSTADSLRDWLYRGK